VVQAARHISSSSSKHKNHSEALLLFEYLKIVED
jgi:hypothetical protein